MFNEIIFLFFGIIGLVIGTHLIIKGALNIAEHFKLSQVFIGLTILAIGTDLPELIVNITGAIHRLGGVETSGLVIGDAIGSCFGQIVLTLGIIGLFSTSLFLTKKELSRDGFMLLGSVAMLFLLGYDGKLTRLEGIALVLVYIAYFIALYGAEMKKEKEVKRAPALRARWAVLSLITGLAILVYSSDIVVGNAVILAKAWGVTQSFIGVVIIGLGTSLPEISISIGALAKKAPRLSVGNLIGSNIFDILLAVGIGGSISGFTVGKNLLFFDIPLLFIVSLIVIILFLTGNKLTKKESVVLLAIYLLYILSKLMSYDVMVAGYFV